MCAHIHACNVDNTTTVDNKVSITFIPRVLNQEPFGTSKCLYTHLCNICIFHCVGVDVVCIVQMCFRAIGYIVHMFYSPFEVSVDNS